MVIEMKVKDLEDWDGKTKSKSFSGVSTMQILLKLTLGMLATKNVELSTINLVFFRTETFSQLPEAKKNNN